MACRGSKRLQCDDRRCRPEVLVLGSAMASSGPTSSRIWSIGLSIAKWTRDCCLSRVLPLHEGELGFPPQPIGTALSYHLEGSITPRGQHSLRDLRRTLLSFEAVFILFLFAGIYKANPRFAWFPVDMTAFFGAVSLASGAIVLLGRGLAISRAGVRLVQWGAVFTCYMAVSLVWSPSRIYGPAKVLLMGTIVLWSLGGAALIIAPDPLRVRRFILLIQVFAVWAAVEFALLVVRSSPGEALLALGSTYLGLGRIFGIGIIPFVLAALYRSRTFVGRSLNLGAATLLFAMMLLVGGRGPLLAVLVTLSWPVFSGIRLSAKHILVVRRYVLWLMVLEVSVVGWIAYLVSSGNELFMTLRRVAVLLTPGGGSSAATRVSFFEAAWLQWMERPLFGNGVGSWPLIALGLDVRGYPHNIILEVLSELGLVGLILLLVLVGYGVSAFRVRGRSQLSPMALTLAMIFLNAALNAMVTGDIADNRFLFTALGLLPAGRVLGQSNGV